MSYRKLGVQEDWEVHLVQRPSFVVKDTPTFIPYEIKVQSRNSFGSGPEPKIVTGYSGEDGELNKISLQYSNYLPFLFFDIFTRSAELT